MLFNSHLFIFLFLPLALGIYFFACAMSHRVGVYALITASLVFYACYDTRYIALMLSSILFNYGISCLLARSLGGTASLRRRLLVTAGVGLNIALLGYYKYTDFFITNVNSVFGATFALQHILLPLGISFFTFQQIGYVVDVYKGENSPPHLSEYGIFVLFFPHLVAGPIVHNKEIIVQFQDDTLKTPRWANLYEGLALFCVGLFKKVALADTFATYVGPGFDGAAPHFLLAWGSSLAYTMQIYFDFSGYSEMAIGLACMFNIKFPQNFNEPYRALDIQDFWRRWHMTLSRFLRQYLYIPLGGNRKGWGRTLLNLFITFLLGGIWHGASWCFVIWGVLHGAGIVAHRLWSQRGLRLPKPLAWGATFLFVNVAWVFFRARTLDAALAVLGGMVGLNGVLLPKSLAALAPLLPSLKLSDRPFVLDALVVVALVDVALRPWKDILERYVPGGLRPAGYAGLFLVAIFCGNKISEFIYFQF